MGLDSTLRDWPSHITAQWFIHGGNTDGDLTPSFSLLLTIPENGCAMVYLTPLSKDFYRFILLGIQVVSSFLLPQTMLGSEHTAVTPPHHVTGLGSCCLFPVG